MIEIVRDDKIWLTETLEIMEISEFSLHAFLKESRIFTASRTSSLVNERIAELNRIDPKSSQTDA